MFYATWRESKRAQSLFGLIFAFALFFNLFLPNFASAGTVWEGTGSSRSIEDVIGESIVGGLYSFGWSIDADGSTVVVGYPNYPNSDQEIGEAFILQYNDDGSWTRLAKLSTNEPVKGGRFGWGVAVEGDTVVVTSFRGISYIFTKPDGGWRDLTTDDAKRLTPDGERSQTGFGHSVDMQNDTIAVGAPNALPSTGAVYIYKKPVDGWVSTSSSSAILPGVVSDAWTGYSVALSEGGNVLVSGSADGRSNEVLVYADTSGDWSSFSGPARLIPENVVSTAVLGMSVTISANGDTVVAGARHDQHSITCTGGWGPGAAYVFYKDGAAWSAGIERPVARLIAGDLNPNFDPSIGQTMPQDCANIFGESVAIKDDLILVGSPWYNAPEYNRGSVFVYAKPAGGWVDATENVKLKDVLNSNGYPQYYGQDVVFLNDRAFSISAYNGNGATGFSSFPVTQPYASFLTVPAVVSDNTGYVTTSVSVLDLRNNQVDLAVEYSIDKINWHSTTLVEARDGNGSLSVSTVDGVTLINDIAETILGRTVDLVWDSLADGIGQSNTVYLRVTPVGGVGSVSNVFIVNNPVSLWAPAGAGASAVSTSTLNLFWNRVLGATTYRVSSTLGNVDTISTSTVVVGLTVNTTYEFFVAAGDSLGNYSEYSTPFSAYTLANAPSNLTATVNGQTQITLNWSGDATQYYADNGSSNSGWISATTYAFNGLTCATDYNFSVKGRNGDQVETSAVTTTARTADCGGNGGPGNNGSGNGGGSSAIIPTIMSVALAESGPVSSTTVHVISDVTNVAEMMLSENSDFTGASWQTYTTNTPYVLSAGNGQKTIYVKYRSASLGVSETRNLTIVLANLGGQDNPGQSGGNNGQNSQTNSGSSSSTTNVAPTTTVNASSVPLTAGIKIVGNSTTSQAGRTNSNGSTNTNPLEIQLSTTSDNNNLVPTAQAGSDVGFGAKARGYFARVFNSENNWVIALATIIAAVIIGGGWFVYKRKKGDKHE